MWRVSRLLKNYRGEPSAASRGTRTLSCPVDMPGMLRSVRLASGLPRGAIQQPVRGFTLLEVLIALAVLAVLAAALYGTFFSVSRARDAAAEGAEQRREIRSTLDLLRREIASALPVQNSYGATPGSSPVRFVVEDRDLFGAPASTLSMAVVAPPSAGSLPSSDLRYVEYRPVEHKGKLVLTRSARELFGTVKAIPYPQMEEIKGFLVECRRGTNWEKTWDTQLNGGLPEAVRVTIFVLERGKEVPYSAVVKLRMK